jgi:hypothetical protein
VKIELLDTVEVATGCDPEAALTAAVAGLPNGVYRLTTAHDDTCPCPKGSPIRDCDCEIVRLVLHRVSK